MYGCISVFLTSQPRVHVTCSFEGLWLDWFRPHLAHREGFSRFKIISEELRELILWTE